MKPLSDRVVLRPLKPELVTKSGIYIPETANKEKPDIFEVIAIWPGKKDSDMSVLKEGDKVLCSKYAWDDIKIEDVEYKIIGIEYVLAIMS
jgi:chaperonin GroES